MKNKLKQTINIQEIETEASPSLINIKESGLKIVLGDLTQNQDDLISLRKPKITVQYIARMIEKIRKLSRKRKTPESGDKDNTCHLCRNSLEPKLLVNCNRAECNKKFCFRCLNTKFSQNLQAIYETCMLLDWSCRSCENLCGCKECEENNSIKKSKIQSKVNKIKAQHTRVKRIKKHKGSVFDDQQDCPIKINQDSKNNTLEISSFSTEPSVKNSRIIEKKIRSKTLARKFILEKKSDEPENHLSDDDEKTNFVISEKNMNDQENETKESSIVENRISKTKKEKCHMCHHLIDNTNIAACSVEQCKKYYCCSCIIQFYQEHFDLTRDYNTSLWICYSCGGSCKCTKCERRRNAVEKNQNTLRLQEALLNPKMYRKEPKFNKRRIKYYDTLSEEEEEKERLRIASAQETFKVSLSEDEEFFTDQRKQTKTHNRYSPINALETVN